MTALSLNDLAAHNHNWPMLADLLLSGQVPTDREIEICLAHPAFGAWFARYVADLRQMFTPDVPPRSPRYV